MADVWNLLALESAAPTAKAWADAKKLSAGGAFTDIRPQLGGSWTADTRGSTGTYVTAVTDHSRVLGFACDCPSHQHPCKHALGLAYHLATHPELRAASPPPVVAPELDALVRACFATPKANLPRLVLADYLDEQGDNDRATILRIQCELPPPKRGKKPQIQRGSAKDLKAAIDRLKPRFLPKQNPWIEWKFVRGFLAVRLALWSASHLTAVAELFHLGWIEAAEVFAFDPDRSGSACPLLRQVGTLDFTRQGFGAEGLVTVATEFRPGRADGRIQKLLVSRQDKPALKRLLGQGGKKPPAQPHQYHSSLTPEKVELLASSGMLTGVRTLTLGGDLRDDGAERLAALPALQRLQFLRLEDLNLSERGWQALAGISAERLTDLQFVNCALGDAGVRTFCAGSLLPSSSLFLSHTGFGADGARALAECAGLAGLKQLSVSGSRFGDSGLAALLTSPHFADEFELHASVCDVTRDGLLATAFAARQRANLHVEADDVFCTLTRRAGSHVGFTLGTVHGRIRPNWPVGGTCPESLSSFTLRGMTLSRDDFRRLRRWFGDQTVERLELLNGELRNGDVPELLELVRSLRPEVLVLSANEIGMRGCEALAASDALASVRELDLSWNPIRLSGALALAKSEHRAALTALRVVGCDLSTERRQLRAAFKGVKVTM